MTNNTSKKYENLFLNVTFLDKKGNMLKEMLISVSNLNPNDSKLVIGTIASDIINAYDYTFEETQM